MHSKWSVEPRMEPWVTPALTGYSCKKKIPIQNHLKLSQGDQQTFYLQVFQSLTRRPEINQNGCEFYYPFF